MPGHSYGGQRSFIPICPPANQGNESHATYPVPAGIIFKWRRCLFVAITPGIFFRGVEDQDRRGSPSSIFPGGSAEKERGAILSSVHRRVRAICANESSPSHHHPTKTPLKAQSIRFPYLSSSLIGGTRRTGLRDHPASSPSVLSWTWRRRTSVHLCTHVCSLMHAYGVFWKHVGDGGGSCGWRSPAVSEQKVRSAKTIPDPDEPFEQYQTYL
jgi:hypothetical protein